MRRSEAWPSTPIAEEVGLPSIRGEDVVVPLRAATELRQLHIETGRLHGVILADRMTGIGRVCEVTNGRCAVAKRDKPGTERQAASEDLDGLLWVGLLSSPGAEAVIGEVPATLDSTTVRFERSAVSHCRCPRRTGPGCRRHSAGEGE